MGAFFLVKKEKTNTLDMVSAMQVFREKGFAEPNIFHLGSCELRLYRKQLVDTPNYLLDDKCSLFVVGTVAYKGKSYTKTIKLLQKDYLNNSLDYKQLYGNYCLIFYVDGKIEIINDSMNVYELFTDSEGTFLSSSFLAAAESQENLTIDHMASLEKLMTGYIVGEPTLFQQIKRVIPSHFSGNCEWMIHKWSPIRVAKPDHDRRTSVKNRAKAVRSYLESIQGLAQEYNPELGLSGGYDSRLIFAASQNVWPIKLAVHTHSTEGVHIHDVEKTIVAQMAETKDTPINVIPTHNMDYYEGSEVKEILRDGYYFFDGRCAYNMGAFSPTYTRAYKLQTIGEHRLTLNGLGGEMYRNYYLNLKPLVNAKQWMKANIYPDSIDFVLKKEDFKELHDYICKKMNQELPFRWGNWLTKFNINRYYSEMRMPDCDALNCNAHNQIAFYLTPFIERRLVEDAYRGRRYSGKSGEYQADMIKELDQELASFTSHYGFSFDKPEPLKRKLYLYIRGLLPDSIWNFRMHRMIRKGVKTRRNREYFERVLGKCDFLKESSAYIQGMFPELDFNYLRMDYAMMPNSTYIGVVFYMMKDKICK